MSKISDIQICKLSYQSEPFVHARRDGMNIWLRQDGTWTLQEDDSLCSIPSSDITKLEAEVRQLTEQLQEVEEGDKLAKEEIERLKKFESMHPPTLVKEFHRMEDEIKRLAPLADFGKKALEEVKECVLNGGYEIAAEDLADFAVECELMQFIPYDPNKHGKTEFDCEPGDMIYYWGKEVNDGS